ncbi:hypothetical protein PG989_007999 [Apiospora arundinis]
MQTENRPLPRRAASHGTLRSSYANHARPLHKPLRSVNENSALLPSPGALESMLKTTTETGDIGIFTIKPIRTSSNITPSSAQHDTQGSSTQYRMPVRRSTDDFRRQDDRRRLPSYRDTTSEILSMYGSTSQGSSANSVFSHSIDDLSQRSYSMTTVGSRHLSHNKSSNTLQNHFSGGTLQRPRSPFPYPTRLKRPGARPSSPAVTESGLVDYSRMVEIDRISLRTGYGLGAPALSLPPRRLPHSGARLDVHTPRPTLQTVETHYIPDRQSGANSSRTVSAASETSCSPSCCEKIHSSSTRTSSLTSVINMYRRMPPTRRYVQFGTLEPPPRYYDYTEDFEFKQPFVTATVEPIAPTPTRIPSVHRSLVLREGSEEQLSVSPGSDDSPDPLHTDSHLIELEKRGEEDEVESHQTQVAQTPSERDVPSAANAISKITKSSMSTDRGTDIDFLPSQTGRDSLDTFSPNLDMEPGEARVYSYQTFRSTIVSRPKTTSLERQVEFHGGKTPTIHSKQGVIMRSDTQDFNSEECELGDGRGNENQRRSVSEPVNKHWGFLPNHGSPEHGWRSQSSNSWVLIPEECDKQEHTEIPTTSGDNQSAIFDTGREIAETVNENEFMSTHNSALNGVSPRTSKGSGGVPVRHRGNMGLGVVTHNPSRANDMDFPQLTHECSNTPLLSPKPISPARQLKVKNSIPQLMKALPPLPNPNDVFLAPSSIVDVDECAEILQPFSLSRSGTPRARNQRGLQKPREGLSPGYPDETQKKLPRIRFKTKMPTTYDPSRRDSRPWNSESNYPWCKRTTDVELSNTNDDAGSHNSGKSNMKTPTAFNSYRPASSPLTETVRRYPDIQSFDVIQSLTSQKPRDLFTASSRLRNVFRSTSDNNSRGNSHVRGEHDVHYSPDIANEVNPEADLSLVAAHDGDSRRLSKAQSRAYGSGQSRRVASSQDTKVQRGRGLEKRLSNLGRLLARNRGIQSEHQVTLSGQNQASEAKQKSTLETNLCLENVGFDSRSFIVSEGNSGEPTRRRKFRRRVRDKLTKWLKGTRRKIRAHG